MIVIYGVYFCICCVFAVLPAVLITHFFVTQFSRYHEGRTGTPEKQAAVERVKQQGNFAVAYMIKCGPSDNEIPHRCQVKYEFEFKGKKYRFVREYAPGARWIDPPSEMEVYWRTSPKYAKPYSDFGHLESERKYVFFVAWLVIAAVIFVLLVRELRKVGAL